MQPATHEQLPILQAATKTKRFEMRRNVRRLGCLELVFISAWLWPGAASQEPEDRKAEKPKPTGVATGAPHAPVKMPCPARSRREDLWTTPQSYSSTSRNRQARRNSAIVLGLPRKPPHRSRRR